MTKWQYPFHEIKLIFLVAASLGCYFRAQITVAGEGSAFNSHWLKGAQIVRELEASHISTCTWDLLLAGKRRFGHDFQLTETLLVLGEAVAGQKEKAHSPSIAEVCQGSAQPQSWAVCLVLTEQSQHTWSHLQSAAALLLLCCLVALSKVWDWSWEIPM